MILLLLVLLLLVLLLLVTSQTHPVSHSRCRSHSQNAFFVPHLSHRPGLQPPGKPRVIFSTHHGAVDCSDSGSHRWQPHLARQVQGLRLTQPTQGLLLNQKIGGWGGGLPVKLQKHHQHPKLIKNRITSIMAKKLPVYRVTKH